MNDNIHFSALNYLNDHLQFKNDPIVKDPSFFTF